MIKGYNWDNLNIMLLFSILNLPEYGPILYNVNEAKLNNKYGLNYKDAIDNFIRHNDNLINKRNN